MKPQSAQAADLTPAWSPDGARVAFSWGPVVDADGVRFQLWAPAAASVAVVVNDEPHPLEPGEAGFWACKTAAAAGARYHFEVDGQRVPDPASRFQPEDVGGPSQVVAADDYAWQNAGWRGRPWEEAVFYEAHVGVLGGYKGVLALLPELAALGITALELMPLGDFAGERNWGYDGVLPFAPDSAYGSPDDLRALVDAAHGLGMMVFLDVVYNHFGPEGNFLPSYAAQFFDPATPTPWGAAIDFAEPAVRRYFIENALYWLQDFRFDGLRLDAVHAIGARDWLVELAAEVRACFAGRHVHLVLENENNDAGLLTEGFDAQWNDDFHNVMHVLLTGERHAYYQDFADRPSVRLARCLGEGFIYQGEGSPNHDGKPRGQPSAHLPPGSFVPFLQNHDQVGNRALGERLTVLARPAALQAAMALLLLCPQIPLLFMGEEVGARAPFLFFTDFHGELADAVREGRRREFAASPGFADASARAGIPDPNDIGSFLQSRWSADAPDAALWRGLVGDLLRLRREWIVPFLRGTQAIGAAAVGHAAIVARWRLANNAVLTLASNFGEADAIADLPDTAPFFGLAARPGILPADTTLAWIEVPS